MKKVVLIGLVVAMLLVMATGMRIESVQLFGSEREFVCRYQFGSERKSVCRCPLGENWCFYGNDAKSFLLEDGADHSGLLQRKGL